MRQTIEDFTALDWKLVYVAFTTQCTRTLTENVPECHRIMKILEVKAGIDYDTEIQSLARGMKLLQDENSTT